MKLLAKSEPDIDKLRKRAEAGFDYCELYLNSSILDNKNKKHN